jgi:FKBP-type peptidyl-prolyl cis-trans isomerase SlpA
MTPAAPVVRPDSYLTLHYRVSLADSGGDVVSTFGARPATLQLGAGQMAEPLERCLVGLAEGSRAQFELAPGDAFGVRNPELLRRVSRATLDERSGPDAQYAPGDLVEFPAPDGGRFAGVLKEIDADSALFDFNHPLAGQRVRLEVEILGIL